MIGGLASAIVLAGLRVVGADRARRRVARDALAAARERGLARPQHRRGSQRAARRRLRLPAGRRSACQQGAAAVRPGRLDHRPLRQPPHPSSRAPVRGDAACASGRWCGACCSSSAPTCSCSGRSANAAANGRLSLGEAVMFAQSAVGTSMIAFGGLNWALDGAAAPVAAVLRLEPAMGPAGALSPGHRTAADCPPAKSASAISASPTRGAHRCSKASTSRSLPVRHWPSSGRTAPARPRSRSCCAGSMTRNPAPSRSTASTSASSSWARGGRGSPPCSRISFASSCRSATTSLQRAHLTRRCMPRSELAGAANLASLDTVLARGYEGGTDLSGGQWQRVALARALCAVELGAGVVLLDEPTAQLDVRGEAEIFDRILAATRHCTTILISHRFSTVRHADRICVLEHGRVDRARHPRRADGAGRALPDDVRPPGPAVHGPQRTRMGSRMTSSPERSASTGARR